MKITKFMNAVMMTAAITFGGGAVQAQQSGGSLVFLVQPEPPTMAGYVSTSGPIGLLGPKIYDGLFDYDNDGKMIPVLAESVDMSEDGKTVTFNLRKGVTWHDGKPLHQQTFNLQSWTFRKKFTLGVRTHSKKFLVLILRMPIL